MSVVRVDPKAAVASRSEREKRVTSSPRYRDGKFVNTRPTEQLRQAPGLSMAALRAALRERIDPAFMPRPLLFVERLPRNSTGKLPREALQALARTHDPKGRGRHAD